MTEDIPKQRTTAPERNTIPAESPHLPGSPSYFERVHLGLQKKGADFEAWWKTLPDRERVRNHSATAGALQTRMDLLGAKINDENDKIAELEDKQRDLGDSDSTLQGLFKKTGIGMWIQEKQSSRIGHTLAERKRRLEKLQGEFRSATEGRDKALASKSSFNAEVARKAKEAYQPIQEKLLSIEMSRLKIDKVIEGYETTVSTVGEKIENALAQIENLKDQRKQRGVDSVRRDELQKKIGDLQKKVREEYRPELKKAQRILDKAYPHQLRLENTHRSILGGAETLEARFSGNIEKVSKPDISDRARERFETEDANTQAEEPTNEDTSSEDAAQPTPAGEPNGENTEANGADKGNHSSQSRESKETYPQRTFDEMSTGASRGVKQEAEWRQQIKTEEYRKLPWYTKLLRYIFWNVDRTNN